MKDKHRHIHHSHGHSHGHLHGHSHGHHSHETDASVSPENILETIESILSSRHFAQAPKKQRFVQLICDYHLAGRSGEINEYLIGREVYERNERYSPAEDPVVRVAAHDVRKRLEQYYQHEGKDDDLRLEIPIGSYEPVFRRSSSTTGLETASADLPAAAPGQERKSPSSAGSSRKWRLWMGVGLAAVALMMIFALRQWDFGVRPPATASGRSADRALYDPVWNAFFNSDDPTILVLSNPIVFVLVNRADPESLRQKSIPLPDDQVRNLEEALRPLNENIPEYPRPPRLSLSPVDYTGLGEAIGVHHITDLFRSQGLSVTLKQSRNMTAEDLKDRNLILLGGAMSNVWSGKLQVKEDFAFTSNISLVNRAPQPGEESEYRTSFDEKTERIREDYALVTVKPAAQQKNRMMVLEGLRTVGTGAAAELVTGKSYLEDINRRLAQMAGGPPRYYQVLLKVGVENQVPATISVLALHKIHVPEN